MNFGGQQSDTEDSEEFSKFGLLQVGGQQSDTEDSEEFSKFGLLQEKADLVRKFTRPNKFFGRTDDYKRALKVARTDFFFPEGGVQAGSVLLELMSKKKVELRALRDAHPDRKEPDVDKKMLDTLKWATEATNKHDSVNDYKLTELILVLIKLCEGNEPLLADVALYMLEAVFLVGTSSTRNIATNKLTKIAAGINIPTGHPDTVDPKEGAIAVILANALGISNEKAAAWVENFCTQYPGGSRSDYPKSDLFEPFKESISKHWCIDEPQQTNTCTEQVLHWIPPVGTAPNGGTSSSSSSRTTTINRRPATADGSGFATTRNDPDAGREDFLIAKFKSLLEDGNISHILRITKELDDSFPGHDFEQVFLDGKLYKNVTSILGNELLMPLPEPSRRPTTPNSVLAFNTNSDAYNMATFTETTSPQPTYGTVFDYSAFVQNPTLRPCLECFCWDEDDDLRKALEADFVAAPESDFEKARAGILLNPLNFRFTKVLGFGSFGIVLKAHIDNHVVAVKFEQVRKDDVLHDFIKPLVCWSNLHSWSEHPNVAAADGDGVLDDTAVVQLLGYTVLPVDESSDFIQVGVIMELCESDLEFELQSQRRLLNHKTITWQSFHDWIVKTMKGCIDLLVLCHSKNVVHRDLKPENIFIAGDGKLKLADFGLARKAAKDGHMTRGTGSPDYMAPEVNLKTDYSMLCDVWSLGAILYRMIMDKIPSNRDKGTWQKQLERLPGENACDEDLKPLMGLCKEMLQWEPSDRIAAVDAQRLAEEIPYLSP